jgi:hypothetical protein
MLRINDARALRIRQCVGPRAVCTFAEWHEPGTAVVYASYYQPLILAGLQSALQPRGANIVPAVPFSHPDINTPSRNFQFNPAQYSFPLPPFPVMAIDIKGPKKNTKRETHACAIPPSRASFYLAYESSQVRPPLRFHGLIFLFDLAAGSLALKFLENTR